MSLLLLAVENAYQLYNCVTAAHSHYLFLTDHPLPVTPSLVMPFLFKVPMERDAPMVWIEMGLSKN